MSEKNDKFGVISEVVKEKAAGRYKALWHELNGVPHVFDTDVAKGKKNPDTGDVVWDIDTTPASQGWEFDKKRPYVVTNGDPENIDSYKVMANGTRLRLHNCHKTTNEVVTFDLLLVNKNLTASTDPSFVNRGLRYTSRKSKIKIGIKSRSVNKSKNKASKKSKNVSKKR